MLLLWGCVKKGKRHEMECDGPKDTHLDKPCTRALMTLKSDKS